MSSVERMLGLLNAFHAGAPSHSGEALIRAAGVSRATGYRYIRSLQQAGLLYATSAHTYMLGPRIVELDRQLRECDPLYQAAGAPMRQLTRRTGHSSILCMLYADRVLCVRDERSGDGPSDLFNRGQSRPLFVAAASKVILAFLNGRQLRRVWTHHQAAIAHAGLGRDWTEFRATLGAIRDRGYCCTVGEFRPGIAGVSAPVFNEVGAILGSVGLAITASAVADGVPPDMVDAVRATAAEITAAVREAGVAAPGPPRAVGGSRPRKSNTSRSGERHAPSGPAGDPRQQHDDGGGDECALP